MINYITVTFKSDQEKTAILTALLMDSGFEGVEEREEATVASVPSDIFDEDEVRSIFNQFEVAYQVDAVAQQNWNARWEESFEPVLVDDFAVVRAEFHAPVPGVKYDIIVTPKMSFGTGHHATTFMMLQAMKDLAFEGSSVIDFGTGTGVLAILAEKMGASEVWAIDNDQWSINNARENIEANNCTNIHLLLADQMSTEKKASIILANINLNVIKANLSNMKASCDKHARVLISGFLAEDEAQMNEILTAANFHIVKNIYKNNWMAMLIKIAE
jgi:ribosomal protein L11 methyltransferase